MLHHVVAWNSVTTADTEPARLAQFVAVRAIDFTGGCAQSRAFMFSGVMRCNQSGSRIESVASRLFTPATRP